MEPISKYAVQYNNGRHACGPIVLLNALRHQGHKVSRRHLPWLARKLKSGPNHGVYVSDLMRVARQMGAFKRMLKVPNSRFNAELVKGNAIAMRIGMDHKEKDGTIKSRGHYLIITAIWCHRGNVSYYVCNIGGKCRWMEFADIDKYYLRFNKRWWISHFWLVPMNKKKGLRLIG